MLLTKSFTAHLESLTGDKNCPPNHVKLDPINILQIK